MFGTIMRARLKPGRRDEFESLFRESMRTVPADDWVSLETAFEDKDPDRVVLIVRFRDRDSYLRNADDPQTNADYQKMVELFDGPPEWIDVNYAERFANEGAAAR
jgi:quinol monooxygenase YgiN